MAIYNNVGNDLFNDALNTFYLWIYGVGHNIVKNHSDSGRKEDVLFNDALNTFYLRLYGVGHMVKDHSVREETRCRHMGYSFQLTARVLLYAPTHRQDRTYHDLCYTSRGALALRQRKRKPYKGIFYMYYRTERIAHTKTFIKSVGENTG